MTIYSQHANRGKIQILATYKGSASVTSSTVTSVSDAATAEPLVDALNRISACATMPVSVWDERNAHHARYPHVHLEAIIDSDRRAELLNGAYSLWYEYAKLLLHRALADLDAVVASAPGPVKTAVEAELDAEVKSLRASLREYAEGASEDDAEPERFWDFEDPFVLFDGGMEELSAGVRKALDRVEDGLSADQIEQAVTDLRLLGETFMSGEGAFLIFEEGHLSISDDPSSSSDGSDRYFLDLQAPLLSEPYGPTAWTITINRWVPDDPEDEYSSATSEPVLECSLPARPSETELISLLRLSGKGEQQQFSAWAATPEGAALGGTPFVVTTHFER